MGLLEDYLKKRDYWKGVEKRLRTAYNEITNEKLDLKTVYGHADGLVDDAGWKGNTANEARRLFGELKDSHNSHMQHIDDIHDGINREKNNATNQYEYFFGLIRGVNTELENLVN